MIIRQLKEHHYERLNNALIKKGRAEPLDASYTVDMHINGVEYAVKVQPERDNRMAVLQAFKIDRDEDGLNFELITSSNLLSSFLEILIYQELR